MNKMSKFILKIFNSFNSFNNFYIIVIIFFILAISLFYFIKINNNSSKLSETFNLSESYILKEGLETENQSKLNIKMDFASSFCDEAIKGGDILSKCGALTNTNCNATSCCVWTKDKCVPGDADGPTFNTDENGKTKDIDYYYYKNKRYP